jgi:DNA-binding response OmpR family regulator
MHAPALDGRHAAADALLALAPLRHVASDESLVLLAEDDEDILLLLATRLERDGYRVARARDGREAVALARCLRPAIAVLDVSMPLVTGLEATRELRADPTTASLPIILLTARASERDIQAGAAAGATAYVTKPFSPQDLAARIRSVLGDA